MVTDRPGTDTSRMSSKTHQNSMRKGSNKSVPGINLDYITGLPNYALSGHILLILSSLWVLCPPSKVVCESV